jgi:hypothetical protein
LINIELSRNQHRLNPEITGFRIDNNAVYSVDKKIVLHNVPRKIYLQPTFSYTAADGTEKTKIKPCANCITRYSDMCQTAS